MLQMPYSFSSGEKLEISSIWICLHMYCSVSVGELFGPLTFLSATDAVAFSTSKSFYCSEHLFSNVVTYLLIIKHH